MDRVIEAAVGEIFFAPFYLRNQRELARTVLPRVTLEADLSKEMFFCRFDPRSFLFETGGTGPFPFRLPRLPKKDRRIGLNLLSIKLNQILPNLFRFLVRDDRPGEFEIESQGMTIPTLFFMVERGVPINPLGVVLDIRSMTVTAGERHLFPIGSFQIRFQMNLVVEFDGNGIFLHFVKKSKLRMALVQSAYLAGEFRLLAVLPFEIGMTGGAVPRPYDLYQISLSMLDVAACATRLISLFFAVDPIGVAFETGLVRYFVESIDVTGRTLASEHLVAVRNRARGVNPFLLQDRCEENPEHCGGR